MKHNVTSYLSICEKEIENICRYLFNNPETSYKENLSSKFICNILSKHNFNIEHNFLDIDNSFIAKKGCGHPKICFLCEYDAIAEKGHITGHNALSAISTVAALCLGNNVDSTGLGSITIIGCPGEYLGGTKGVMAKQGVFDDIDAVLVIHPDTETSESGSSSSVIPLSIDFESHDGLSFLSTCGYSSLDAMLLTFNTLNALLKGFPKDLEINSILSEGGITPLLIPNKSEAKFYIRANSFETALFGENKLKEIARYIGKLTHLTPSFSFYEPPTEELNTNQTLNRLLINNLKESGIIDIHPPKKIKASLGIGTISKKVPCVHSYISITDDPKIQYGSIDFANSTVSKFCYTQCAKAALSLALTGLDLMENEDLLKEAKKEFFQNTSTP